MGVIEIATGLPAMPTPAGEQQRGGRERDVYTNADKRAIDRAAKVVKQHGDTFYLKCGNELCPDRLIHLEVDASAERGAVLRCGCTDRTFSKA